MGWEDSLIAHMPDGGSWQAFVDAANTNQGFLALVGIWLALLALLTKIQRLRFIAIVSAVASVALSAMFLTPRTGAIPTAPEENNSVDEVAIAPTKTSENPTYRVTGVACDDVLNVRTEPGLLITGAVVSTLACDETGITLVGPTTQIGFSNWWLISANNQSGWVNSRYLILNKNPTPAHSVPDHQTQPESCQPLSAGTFVSDQRTQSCLVPDLTVAASDKVFWTGACGSDGFASGRGALRIFAVGGKNLDLRFAFLGHIQNRSELAGAWVDGSDVMLVCSGHTGMISPNNQVETTNARDAAAAGLEQAIQQLRIAGHHDAAVFYERYRSSIAGLSR